jgi:hypothetical protein
MRLGAGIPAPGEALDGISDRQAEVTALGYLSGDGDRRRDNQAAIDTGRIDSQVIGKTSSEVDILQAEMEALLASQNVKLTFGRKAGRNHTAAPSAPLTVP